MATIYRCDRCDNESNEQLANVSIPRHTNFRPVERGDNYNKDLCDSCVRELNEWIKPRSKKAPL